MFSINNIFKVFFLFCQDSVLSIYLYDHYYVKVHVFLMPSKHYNSFGPRLEVKKTFFMLNSTEHEITNYFIKTKKKTEKFTFFLAFSAILLINV